VTQIRLGVGVLLVAPALSRRVVLVSSGQGRLGRLTDPPP
jgi:hypothetical protein